MGPVAKMLLLVVLWAAGSPVGAAPDPAPRPATPPPVPASTPMPVSTTVAACGDPWTIGLLSSSRLVPAPGEALRLEVSLEMFSAPGPQSVRPQVLVDGAWVHDLEPIELSCGQELSWSTPPLRPLHGVHWFLNHWPEVPEELAAMGFEQAVRSYGLRPPATRPWLESELRRPADAEPAGRSAADGAAAQDAAEGAAYDGAGGVLHSARWRQPLPGDEADDLVMLLSEHGDALEDRLLRLRVGEARTLRVRYLALDGSVQDEPLLLVCFAGGTLLHAFGGRPSMSVATRPGLVLEAEGTVVLERPGWHRLRCHLLADGEGEAPISLPRPLNDLYLWADP